MTAPAIVSAWLHASENLNGLSKPMALESLNKSLNTTYSLSRLGEWLNGKRLMPDKVRAYMLTEGIGVLLENHGIEPPTNIKARIKLAQDLA